MTADLCHRGKQTQDQLDDTKDEMRQMQETFISMEKQMREEKDKIEEELCLKKFRYVLF